MNRSPSRTSFSATTKRTASSAVGYSRPSAFPPAASLKRSLIEATGGQFNIESSDPTAVNMDLVHTLTGPVYVEGAEPGDILAVELLEIEVGAWGWMAIIPDFGVLTDDFSRTKVMKTFALDKVQNAVEVANGVRVPFRPFAGVMGVAPDTDEMLETDKRVKPTAAGSCGRIPACGRCG